MYLPFTEGFCILLQDQHEVKEEEPQMDFCSVWQNRKQLSVDLEQRRRIVALGLMTDHGSSHDQPSIYTGDSTRYDKGMIPGYTGLCRWHDHFDPWSFFSHFSVIFTKYRYRILPRINASWISSYYTCRYNWIPKSHSEWASTQPSADTWVQWLHLFEYLLRADRSTDYDRVLH